MSMMIRVTKEMKEDIFNDYLKLFDNLTPQKRYFSFRERIGPILRSISIDFHEIETYKLRLYHDCILCDYISGINQELLTERYQVSDSIEYRFHKQKFEEASSLIVRQSLIPFKRRIKLSEVFNAYDVWCNNPSHCVVPYPIKKYEQLILFSTLLESRAISVKIFEILLNHILKWPEDRIAFFVKDVKAWETKMINQINDPSIISKQVEFNVKKFKLEKLNDLGIEIDMINIDDYQIFKR